MGIKTGLGRWAFKAYELLWRLRAARRTIILPPPLVDAEHFAPVFLIGCPRSGTTLLRVMLDSHPNLASPPETFFLLELEKLWASEDAMKGLREMGYDREHVRRKLFEFSAYFLQSYTSSREKQRVVEKTPHYVACIEFIEDLFGPRSQYIMLYRHPLDVVVSMSRHFSIGWYPLMAGYLEGEPEPMVGYARFWADHAAKMLAFEAAHPDRTHRVRYEQIVTEPAPRLKALVAFLGEPWSDDLLTYYEQPHDLGRGDRRALIQQGIVPSIDHWQSLDPALLAQLQAIVQEPAASLGYSLDAPGSPAPAAPSGDLAETATGGRAW